MSHTTGDPGFKDNGAGRCWHCGKTEAEHNASPGAIRPRVGHDSCPAVRRRAWTGGDTPKDHVGGYRGALRNPAYRALVGARMREQVLDWREYWGDLPDPDTARIFAGRARLRRRLLEGEEA